MNKNNINTIYFSPSIDGNIIHSYTYFAYISFKVKNLNIMNNEKQIEYISTLASLISDIGECDIICTDIEHNLKDNISYLKTRYASEENEYIKELIKKDIEYISNTNQTLPSKRIFIISLSEDDISNLKEKILSVTKILSRYELDYEILSEDDIKNILIKYFYNNAKKEYINENELEKLFSFWEPK